MKYIGSIFVFVLLCSVQLKVSAQICYLQEKVVTHADNSVSKSYYTFSDETRLLTEYKYPYSGDEYITEAFRYYEQTLSSVFDGMFTHSYFTDKPGRVDGVIDFDDLGVSNFYQTFTYDKENRLVQHTFFETPFMADTIVSSFNKFYYEGDKMIKLEEYGDYRESDTKPTSTWLYEYTTLKNPEYNPLYFPATTEKYMVSKLIYKDADGVPFDEYCYTRQCTSNKEGYPVKCTVNYLDGTLKEVDVYTYKCK